MESGSKYNRTKHPVTSHANPHCNRTKAPYTAEVYAQAYTAKPHCAAGYNHGEFHIACGTQSIWRDEGWYPADWLDNCDKGNHLKAELALAGSIPASIVIGFVSMKIIRQLAMITTSETNDSFFDIVDGFILSAGTQTLSYNSHKTYSYSDSGNTI
mgnify:FL=1